MVLALLSARLVGDARRPQASTRSEFQTRRSLRGVECVAESGYAEAFHPRKLRLV